MSIAFLFFWTVLLTAAAAAWIWGAGPEKAVAALYVAAAVATILVRPAMSIRYGSVELSVFAIDVLLLIGLTIVVVRSDRWWTVCAMALQSLTVLAHVGRMFNPHLWRLGYQMMAEWAAWPTLLLLAYGTWSAWRRRSRPTPISPG